ncbi:MAG TPA: DUF4260 domain-containing protein [Cyclobacteriaceae bacterium]|nr:DUF4260 domain-containing protein [Cyclobacteriaceae bacterium]
MNKLLKTEEALLFIACVLSFPYFELSWWWFIGFILLPDIGMIGYLLNNKAGAYTYNLLHHRGIAAALAFAGYFLQMPWFLFAGYILFSHAAMDRIFGYGLKYERGFKFTHLGEIGSK